MALDIGVKSGDSLVHCVGSGDPRCVPFNHLRGFETPTEARTAFNEAIALSRDRGWSIVHVSTRNFG